MFKIFSIVRTRKSVVTDGTAGLPLAVPYKERNTHRNTIDRARDGYTLNIR